MRYSEMTHNTSDIYIQEENSLDKEVSHTEETVGFITVWGH
jgi:hypothetical protein